MEQEGKGRHPHFDKNEESLFCLWPVYGPVGPAVALAGPAPTGPWTGAIRAISNKAYTSTRCWRGARSGLDRMVRPNARPRRPVDRPPRWVLAPAPVTFEGMYCKPRIRPGLSPAYDPAPAGCCSVEMWEIIVDGYRKPQDPIRLTSTEFYNRQLDASACDKIRSGVNRKLLDQVNDIDSAKELWDRIVVLQEGTNLIQKALYESAKTEATLFMIREGESLVDAYGRLGALRVKVKGLACEKYNDGFEMNEEFIKSKVIAMIAVKQKDTNLALNLEILTKQADLNADDLLSYAAAKDNMAKAGEKLMAMNRVEGSSHNLALKARADQEREEAYEIEEDEMRSTSDMQTDVAFFVKKYVKKFPISSQEKKRTCYNCDEDSHFANECPYEKRVEKPKFVKGVKPRLKPNPINERYRKNKGRAFVGAEYISDEEGEDELKAAGVVALAYSEPGSLFTYGYSKDYSTESSMPNDIGSSFMARTTHDDDSDDISPSTIVGSCLMAREAKASNADQGSAFQVDYNSLAHMVQKLTLYEQCHPELYQDKFKRPIGLVEAEEVEDFAEDQEVVVAEWARGAIPVSCKWVKQPGPARGFDFDIT
ncbi:hypothetical protein QYE76_056601 [Lolium multiflorum]|uniref:CCHC-type domain-containing protein n=1 Tax=Lolium multiflorum TaxID=4521 RepID=A0AAD8T1X0_LOLMU|nr:hypothetical protein QYE76_056601 [Lolium multiflorum]